MEALRKELLGLDYDQQIAALEDESFVARHDITGEEAYDLKHWIELNGEYRGEVCSD